jgi:hypothetical protein
MRRCQQFTLCSATKGKDLVIENTQLRAALGGREIDAPSGFTVKMDGKTNHLYKPVMIGRISKAHSAGFGRRRAGSAGTLEPLARAGTIEATRSGGQSGLKSRPAG